jgi:hypothetical protein
MTLKQKPAWDISSSGIMNKLVRDHLNPAGATLHAGLRVSRTGSASFFMDHPRFRFIGFSSSV